MIQHTLDAVREILELKINELSFFEVGDSNVVRAFEHRLRKIEMSQAKYDQDKGRHEDVCGKMHDVKVR